MNGLTVVRVTIRGDRSLLMHRWAERSEVAETTRQTAIVAATPREEAEQFAYRDPSGDLYLPGAAVSRLLRESAGGHKQKGSRKSMKYILPAAVLCLDDLIMLHHDDGTPITTFEVDSRPVVIPATKGRIMRHRPRIDEWFATFMLRIDGELVEERFVQQVLEEGGRRVGLGDYRPERGGPFGTFAVTHWAHTD